MIQRNQFSNRRTFLGAAGLGAGSLALNFLESAQGGESNGTPSVPHLPSRARSVIFLFMSGGPSQVDTFDPKPALARLSGKDVPESIARRVPKIKRAGLRNLMTSPWEFQCHGECGMPVSSLFPETAKLADDLCLIRSMTHRNPVHGPGECVALTGTGSGNRPSLGAWTIYGLGAENSRLPAFVAMNLHTDGMQFPQAAGWGSGFLPPAFQGTEVDAEKGVQYVAMPPDATRQKRIEELKAIEQLNRGFLKTVEKHQELEARIRSYEMAFEMQTAAPELFRIESESAATRELYGLSRPESADVGRGCLLARRMAERGVRFIQVRIGGWDAHGNIKANHQRMAARTDRPVAGLLADLKGRGLLDSTLVVWGGEFGRTPTMEGVAKGRDHSPAAYAMWMAGGGVKGGQIIGRTDEIGYTVTERPVTPRDLHATILMSLGIDAKRLAYRRHGLRETPLGVEGGAPVHEVFG